MLHRPCSHLVKPPEGLLEVHSVVSISKLITHYVWLAKLKNPHVLRLSKTPTFGLGF